MFRTRPSSIWPPHGFAYSSDSHSRDSYVALAPGNGHDGLLTVGEVLDGLPGLSADLVVLSACQTGIRNLLQTEGTLGFQRAFFARGARSVLVSLCAQSLLPFTAT
ncbi:MAG: CHAT domain-containing protein [Longimicrobiales bacterium]